MQDEKTLARAKSVLSDFAAVLDARGWQYKKDEENLNITLQVSGEDLPINLFACVSPGSEAFTLLSPMPFALEKDKRAEIAMAVHVANLGMPLGSFDFDFASGDLRFRVTAGYGHALIGKETYDYMLDLALFYVDRYNDRFLMLAKGMIDFERFVKAEQE